MHSIHSVEQLLYTDETPESIHQYLQQQAECAHHIVCVQEKEITCIQQFSEKTPLSVLSACMKQVNTTIHPQSYPLLNTDILSHLTQLLSSTGYCP